MKTDAMNVQTTPALVPKLRFPEFREAEGWKVQSLGDVCSLYQAETIASSQFVADGEHLVYGANGVVGRLDRFNHEHEEVAVSCRGNCGEVHLTKPRSWITGNAMVVSPKTHDLAKRFLYWLLGASNLKPVISGSAQPQITRQGFSPFQISIPPHAEQQKIADCLDSLDELIAAQGRKVEALKTHRKGLMQQLFPREGETHPRLRFPEFRNAGEWTETPLCQLGELISGLTYSPDDVRDSGLLVLRSSNVQNGKITLDDNVYVDPAIKGANLSKPNDILICVRNGSKALIGKSALIPDDMPQCTHGAFMTVFRAETPRFAFQLFQTGRYQRQVAGDLGATINSINGSQLLKYKFFVPKPEEQQRIASCLISLDTLITAATQTLDSIKTHKQGLMQQLFPASEALEA